jgi:tetratricopeptide (TPR) repeat protein
MKRLTVVLIGIAILLLASGCRRADPRLAGLSRMEEPSGNVDIAELQAVIDEYGDIVQEKISAGVRQAQYLKLLAHEYIRQEMYGLALEALEEAIAIEPQNQVLHQLAGVSAAYVAKAQGRAADREEYYAISERHYLRAVELAPNYEEAHYGLAVLYLLELNEPLKALPYIDHVLELSSNDTSALFLRANAEVSLGNYDAAIDAYDTIIQEASDDEARRRAQRTRDLLMGGSP